jgi:hypothetical protein
MSKRKRSGNGQSSYKRHGKQPYQYKFRSCEHKTTTMQSTQHWTGRVCCGCGVIIPRRRYED